MEPLQRPLEWVRGLPLEVPHQLAVVEVALEDQQGSFGKRPVEGGRDRSHGTEREKDSIRQVSCSICQTKIAIYEFQEKINE